MIDARPDRIAAGCLAHESGGRVVISVPNMGSIDVLAQRAFSGDWPEHPLGVFDAIYIQVMTHGQVLG
jgi:hypothetical protein